MVRYRCIGYGTTDGNGVATLERDLSDNSISGYTGQGVGEVDFVASAESPNEINSSSDVSHTYEVIDGTFYDRATNETGAKNTYWKNNNAFNVELTANGTHLSETTNGSEYMPSNVPNATAWSDRKLFTVPFVVEFDIQDIVNYPVFRFYNGNSPIDANLVSEGHTKFEVKSTGIKRWVNGTESTISSSEITNQISMGFMDKNASSNSQLTFRNFVVYPI